jgi:uncharacterized membrane protein YoaK (UPF0700 family)
MNRFDRRRQVLAIGLAALAGFVDAVGFLSADGYFVSFMSGNTTRLGVNLAVAPGVAAIPALLITGFVVGVALGSGVAIKAGVRRKPAVLGLVASLLAGAALARGADVHVATLALLVLAMGALNATFQRGGEVAVGLTYMTGALVKLGQGLAGWLLGQPRNGWAAFMALWCGLATGGVIGALAFSHVAGAALWLAAGWALAMLGFSLRLGAE